MATEQDGPETAKCPGCDGEILPGWKACPHCAAALTDTDSARPGGEEALRRIAREEVQRLTAADHERMAQELRKVRGGQPVAHAVERRSVLDDLLKWDN